MLIFSQGCCTPLNYIYLEDFKSLTWVVEFGPLACKPNITASRAGIGCLVGELENLPNQPDLTGFGMLHNEQKIKQGNDYMMQRVQTTS